jgi:hypothetical protein
MEASYLSGLWARAGRLWAAIAMSLIFVAVAHPGIGHAATKKSPIARAAALRSELATVDHRRATLRVQVKRTCATRAASKTCRARRASLAQAESRAAKLRAALGINKSKATKKATAQQAPAATTAGAPAATTTASSTTRSASTAAIGSTPVSGAAAAPAPAAAATPLSDAPVSYQPGVVGWPSPTYDIPAAQRIGARHMRLEFPITSTIDDLAPIIGAMAANDIQVLVLASFNGSMPTAAQAKGLATWATTFGPGGTFWQTHPGGAYAPTLIEFGNETSGWWQYDDTPDSAAYVQRAGQYALRFKDAALAVSAANRHVGVLAQADDPSGGRWLNGMYAAVPNLHDYVSGWVTHPYGSDWRGTLRTTRDRLAAYGAPSTIPWDVTETGLAVDDGRCVDDNYGWDTCMSYATAATTLHTIVAQLRADLGDRLRTLDLYRVRDLSAPGATSAREDYFGVQTVDLQDKGAYTAEARAILAQGT